MERQVVLEGRQVATGYRQSASVSVVHKRLDFGLACGELTCLLGCNGAGKSTLLRTLAAMQPALSGTLELLGRPLERYAVHERARTVGVVLTDRTQTGGLTVYELAALGRQPHTGFFGRLSRRDKDCVEHALKAVGLWGKARSYVAELSDGERQKTMIAKVLVQECPVILLDEPTAFLDVESRMEVMRLLRRLAVEERKAVLLSTHDVDQALAMSDRLWLMTQGHGMLCGETEDLALSGAMDRLFGGGAVRFDLSRGVYALERRAGRTVRIEAADAALRYWAQNFLVRHGFCVLPQEDGRAAEASLALRGAQDMVWAQGGNSFHFQSFAGLSQALER